LTKSLKKPTECYKETHGEIVVTPEEKAAWEKEMVKPTVIKKVTMPVKGAETKKEGGEKKEEKEDGDGGDGGDGGGNDGGDDGGNNNGGGDQEY